MLGTHAILYITPEYKRAVINKLQRSTGHMDIAITRIQPKYRVLANKDPSFFQSAKFNAPDHDDANTRFNIISPPQYRPPVFTLKSLFRA